MTLFPATLVVALPLVWLIRQSRNNKRSRPAQGRIRGQFDPAAYGLPPREQLDQDRAAPPAPLHRTKEIQAIAHAAWDGEWQPAAAYVDAAGQDWDKRWSRLQLLQEIADQGDTWLDDWRREQPDNGDAATLHAQLMLHRAWAIRGTGYAREVPPERMRRFRELLPASMEAAQQAARLAPEDPGPWVVMVTAARGLKYSHAQFRPLWDGLVARAPHHYDGHWQAMQYWCAKWHGSDRLMLDFAERAVRSAPAGSPQAGIYLHALNELVKRSAALPSSREAKDLLEDVARSLGQVPDDNEQLPRLRHLLAHYLTRAGRYDAALEQFRLIGPWCGAAPWTDEPDPVAAFDRARAIAATNAKANRSAAA